MGNSLLPGAAAILALCWPAAALAQRREVGDQCDVSFDPVVISQPYNPMSSNDYAVSFTATARRIGQNNGADYSALLLRHGDYRLPTELYVVTDDGAGGAANVVQERPGPVLRPSLDNSGEIDLRFNSSLFPSVTRVFEMQLRIPAGTEIAPGIEHGVFDVKYLCDYRNGRSDRGHVNRGFLVYFPVNSAVQATLTGSELDFGEIGSVNNLEVAWAPPSRTRRRHYMRVASSGPYKIDVVSRNEWRMTAGGAPTDNDAERIAYQYELLGQTLTSRRPNFTPVRCRASGVSGENIALTAMLTEGGEGKVPSPAYRDVITITITPLAFWARGTERCD